MASEWNGFLEGLSQEMAEDAAFYEITPMCLSINKLAVERNVGYFLPILRAKLLPLLERAEEMANAKTRPDFNEQVELWDAAKEAACAARPAKP